MTLQAGENLAHYRIEAIIGRGGMGEVYRATDTRLGREVAVKLLPEAFARDGERLVRFRREAQTLASLQHPNVASIYGLETVGEQTFLVMEYCPGEDLSAVIARGPLEREDSRSIARQIAEGLEEAHEKGIVHRDLKPANVRLSAEGKVKILDFGLARTMAGESDLSDGSGETMTMAASVTRPGVILGTAAYMSPEQARGRGVDKRTDVWAFGVILYEMITGRKLFTGETGSDVLAAVLRRDIDWDDLPRDLPPEFDYLLHRCLDRDRESRLRDIGEARYLLGDDASSSSLLRLAALPEEDGGRRPRLPAWLWPALAGAALLALAAVLLSSRSTDPAAAPALPGSFTQLTAAGGVEMYGSLGPDSRYFVYEAWTDDHSDVFLQRAGGLNPINLTDDPRHDDGQPAISPDGERIVFTSSRDGGGLYVMGATGESARLLVSGGSHAAWSPDGGRIAYGTENFDRPWAREETSKLWVVGSDGSRPRVIVDTIDAVQPAWSPQGLRIAFWSVREEGGQRDLWTVRPDGSDLRPVTDDAPLDFCPVWSADGRWLFFLSNRGGPGNVWRVAIDEATGEVLGAPEPFTMPSPDLRHLALAPDGSSLIYTAATVTSHVYRLDFDPEARRPVGAARPLVTGSMNLDAVKVSPDGRHIAFVRRGLHEDLYLADTSDGKLRQLTSDVHRDRGPCWMPDGKRLLFYSDRGGKYDVWSIRADGSDLRRLSDIAGGSLWFPKVSAALDLVAAFNETGTYLLDWVVKGESLAAPRPLPPVDAEGARFFAAAWSPDGRRLAGWTARHINQPESRIAICDVAAGSYTVYEPVVWPWLSAGWLPDGRALLYRSPAGIALLDLASGESELVVSEEDLPDLGNFAISGDGTAIYALFDRFESDLWMVDLAAPAD